MSSPTHQYRRIAAFGAAILLIAALPYTARPAEPLAGKPAAIPDVLVYADPGFYDGAEYRSGRRNVLLFDHYLEDGALEVWAGCRELHFAEEEDRIAIIAQALQTAPIKAIDPLFCAWQKLWKKSEQRSRMPLRKSAVPICEHGIICFPF